VEYLTGVEVGCPCFQWGLGVVTEMLKSHLHLKLFLCWYFGTFQAEFRQGLGASVIVGLRYTAKLLIGAPAGGTWRGER
jgi:hypothetical protein